MNGKISLGIADACHEDWNKMDAAEQGRFCQSCQKTVIDFSMMTDKEILNYITERKTQLCGRFTRDQLNRTLVPETRTRNRFTYFWNLVIATFLSTGAASAQTGSKPTKASSHQDSTRKTDEITVGISLPPGLKWVNGVIKDSKTNRPIPYATVYVKGTRSGLSTREDGRFGMNIMFDEDELVLVVSADGYVEQEYRIKRNAGELSFYLDAVPVWNEISTDTLHPKIDLPLGGQGEGIIMGMLVAYKEVELTEKITRNVKELVPASKELTLMPNPVIAGRPVTVKTDLAATGQYTLELIDASGRLLVSRQVIISQRGQLLKLETASSWSKGVYWIRLSSADGSKLANCRMVLGKG